MARKTRVSFIKGMMVVNAIKGPMPELRQTPVVFAAEVAGIGLKTSAMRAKHEPRTACHKAAKKAVTHEFLVNTARVRKKKRRDVNTRTPQ